MLFDASAAGLLSACLLLLDVKAGLHSKWSFLLFALATAMSPRACITVAEDGSHVPITARVGTAVDTVGQAGRPKAITGFQTHTTPVMLGVKDRVEIADERWIALTSALEGIVVVRANPDAPPALAPAGAAAKRKGGGVSAAQ
jgi:26S proteasome regulatory subunit N1